MSSDQIEEEPLWVPGTIALEDVHNTRVILFPTPSTDPDDPLNWSTARKALNYTIVSLFILFTFVELDIGFTAWGQMQLHARKYGRRPIYILASNAEVYTFGNYIGANLVSGLGGAISEVIVQMTVADISFVHHHGTMNGLFVLFESIGAFLGPVASGYIVQSQGWRWTWWWCVIFFGIILVCVIFLFEESKFVPILDAQDISPAARRVTAVEYPESSRAPKAKRPSDDKKGIIKSVVTYDAPCPEFKSKTYLQRMAFVTPSSESIWSHAWYPIITLFTFPAVSYTAIIYGSTLCWFAVMTSLQATYMLLPPYNFSSIGVGLMNVAPIIGGLLGFPFSGYLSDRSIIWLSKKNGGIYEPEIRLWLLLPMIILGPGSILMFGLGLAYGAHWSVLAIGYGIYGFVFSSAGGLSLSYLMDCYQDIIGDTLVGVVFVRNVISVVVLFALTPWVDGMGLRNLHILLAVLAFCIYSLPIALLIWGKKARAATASTYREMAASQVDHRAV
ncbi:sugar transporter [Aspergillus sclerotioniger CBS 115572]|uniref:Sugar transporter n=1 Tax=Aspergillus sclerotioniger CBS 115572 TaxID=1450535 RepID=A0A317XFJ4_9EURO|nr:sugar transporter [Aspergillus sclerotioniger CBS 115572]PWY96567.1 sugar transporter [Aspergillus sclerotioniger CBS 115572]